MKQEKKLKTKLKNLIPSIKKIYFFKQKIPMHFTLIFFFFYHCLVSLTFESNFTFNKNELNRITIPSQMYYDQEAFFLGLDNSINIQFPLISLNQFCHAENFDLMVQNVASFINYESYYKNPEFLMIENIMLFIDQSRILRVFRLDETTDSYVYEISQQDISEEINGLTFLRMFYNKDLKKIFMLIDNSVVIFSLNDYRKPQKEKKIILEESKLPIQAFYKSDCFYLLMDDHIDICVYCFINNLTEIKKEININEELLSKLIGKTITNIQDLALDENILYLCEKNIGMIILNVTDKKNISLLYIDDKAHIEKIALFEKSLTIIRSLPIENGLLQNYLEEYFIDSSIENNFVTILNRNLTLNHSSIISMHISNKYIFLLQDNQIKIYRHSIPNKLFTNNNDFLISVFAKDILALEKAPNMGKNDIILAVFGSEIKLYKIKKLNPKLICIPDDSTPNNLHYKINFYILTQTCRYKNETLWLDGYFSYCNYSNHLNVFVTNKEENGFTSWSITIGFLVAIIILGFFLISALVFFFCYYETLKYKIKKMKENKLYNNVNKEESIDRKQGDIEHKEIELQIN